MLPRVPPVDPSNATAPSRRGVLLAGASLAVVPAVASSCTQHKAHVPTPTETMLDETLALEDTLLAAYDQALGSVPANSSLGRTLSLIRSAHAAHRSALLIAGAQPFPPTTLPTTPTATPTASRDLARTLGATESAAATVRTATCIRAPRELVPLLASLAASESAHAALLRQPA
jgi:hypothetical protein